MGAVGRRGVVVLLSLSLSLSLSLGGCAAHHTPAVNPAGPPTITFTAGLPDEAILCAEMTPLMALEHPNLAERRRLCGPTLGFLREWLAQTLRAN